MPFLARRSRRNMRGLWDLYVVFSVFQRYERGRPHSTLEIVLPRKPLGQAMQRSGYRLYVIQAWKDVDVKNGH
jgi:hypothetical protein